MFMDVSVCSGTFSTVAEGAASTGFVTSMTGTGQTVTAGGIYCKLQDAWVVRECTGRAAGDSGTGMPFSPCPGAGQIYR